MRRRAHIVRMLPDEEPSAKQIEILRAMSGAKRLEIAEQLYWMARNLKIAGVKNEHPDWSEAQVKAEVNRIFLNAGK